MQKEIVLANCNTWELKKDACNFVVQSGSSQTCFDNFLQSFSFFELSRVCRSEVKRLRFFEKNKKKPGKEVQKKCENNNRKFEYIIVWCSWIPNEDWGDKLLSFRVRMLLIFNDSKKFGNRKVDLPRAVSWRMSWKV